MTLTLEQLEKRRAHAAENVAFWEASKMNIASASYKNAMEDLALIEMAINSIEFEADARRYRMLRSHTAPRELADHMCVDCPDFARNETIISRIDSMVDAALTGAKK